MIVTYEALPLLLLGLYLGTSDTIVLNERLKVNFEVDNRVRLELYAQHLYAQSLPEQERASICVKLFSFQIENCEQLLNEQPLVIGLNSEAQVLLQNSIAHEQEQENCAPVYILI